MTTSYQIYDFIKDVNFHIKNKNPILLSSKSDAFKVFLFQLKIFQLNKKIKKDHPMFNEDYFVYLLCNVLYIAKKSVSIDDKFDSIEILGGIKYLRKMKLKKLFG